VEEDRSCVVSATSTPQHIARPSATSWSTFQHSTDQSHCGTKTQPWILEAPVGQRINISLLDFTPKAVVSAADFSVNVHSPEVFSSSFTTNTGDSSCKHHEMKHQYGYIIDKAAPVANRKNVSICSRAEPSRLTNIYLSTSNNVELVLTNVGEKTANNQSLSFLVRIEG
jgi:hypothetical protein